MSFADVLDQLPALTFEQRQILIRRAVEIDDPPLSAEDEALIDSRLSAMREDPSSAVPLEEMKRRLRSREEFKQLTNPGAKIKQGNQRHEPALVPAGESKGG